MFWNLRKGKSTILPTFKGPDYSCVESFISSFCSDYKRWNDYSMAILNVAEDSEKPDMWAKLQSIYEDFVALYTDRLVDLKLISFGTDSSFDSTHLIFGESEELEGEIHQTFFVRHAFLDQSDEFVGILKRSSDTKIQLKQIFYVDPFPDDPSSTHLPFL